MTSSVICTLHQIRICTYFLFPLFSIKGKSLFQYTCFSMHFVQQRTTFSHHWKKMFGLIAKPIIHYFLYLNIIFKSTNSKSLLYGSKWMEIQRCKVWTVCWILENLKFHFWRGILANWKWCRHVLFLKAVYSVGPRLCQTVYQHVSRAAMHAILYLLQTETKIQKLFGPPSYYSDDQCKEDRINRTCNNEEAKLANLYIWRQCKKKGCRHSPFLCQSPECDHKFSLSDWGTPNPRPCP